MTDVLSKGWRERIIEIPNERPGPQTNKHGINFYASCKLIQVFAMSTKANGGLGIFQKTTSIYDVAIDGFSLFKVAFIS